MEEFNGKSQLDELKELAPSWIGITQETVPHPSDERLSLNRYHLHDRSADRVYTLSHQCYKHLTSFVAHTFVAMKGAGFDLTEIPAGHQVSLQKLETDDGVVYQVLMVDESGLPVLDVKHEVPLLAVRNFWLAQELNQDLDIATVAAES